ncbi:MAG: ROK family protein [Methanolinea sp.]|nr:ROK family protein [Methanolinea sp.]
MGLVIAVDLGATRTRAAVFRDGSRAGEKVEEKTPSGTPDPAALVSFLARIARKAAKGTRGEIGAIGLSVAGPVDIRRGILKNPPNMAVRDVPLCDALSREFGVPVRMVNDCHAGLLGELSAGAARGRDNVVYVTLSTGIGGGVYENGRVLLGRSGSAVEIGHLHVDDTYDLSCSCGHRGHWEAYSSGRFLPSFFSQWCRYHGRPHWGPGNARDIFASARHGDDDVLRFVRDLVRINARGVSDVIVAYDPELVVFDGSVVRHNADLLLDPLPSEVDRFLDVPEMVLSGLGGDAPLVGAAIIAEGYATPYGDFGVV